VQCWITPPAGIERVANLATTSGARRCENEPWGIASTACTIAGSAARRSQAAFLDVRTPGPKKTASSARKIAAEQRLAAAEAVARQTRTGPSPAPGAGRIGSRRSADRFLARRRAVQSEPSLADRRRKKFGGGRCAACWPMRSDEASPQAGRKVLLDPTKPVDLTIFPPRKSGGGEGGGAK